MANYRPYQWVKILAPKGCSSVREQAFEQRQR